MVGCGRARSRRLVRVLGTAAVGMAAVLCVGARLAPPVVAVQAEFDSGGHPKPTATPTPQPTPLPTPRPTATPTPLPTETPRPEPTPKAEPSPPPEASAAPAVHPAPVAPPPAPPSSARPSSTPAPSTPHPTPSVNTQLSALPAAVASYAEDGQGQTSPYVVGADAMAGLAVTSSLALATLRRRGLL